MADNYLERQRRDYEEKKSKWMLRKKHLPKIKRVIERPEDDSL
jgi:hypothetical protein